MNENVVPSASIYMPRLDGLRFFAFLLVFVHHLPKPTSALLKVIHDLGWTGVHLFLFLSAFLLTTILIAEHEQTGRFSVVRFYIRRSLRIWPLYFGFCIASAFYEVYRGTWLPSHGYRLAGLVFFVDNVLSGMQGYNPFAFASHLWTISLEEQFYLILPWLLTLWLNDRKTIARRIAFLWGLFVFARVIAVFLNVKHPLIWTSVFSADSLLLGTLVGARTARYRFQRFHLPLLALGIIFLFAGAFTPGLDVSGLHQIFLYSFVALGSAMIVMVSLEASWLEVLSRKTLRYLGKISFGLYVFHFFGIAVGGKLANAIGIQSWGIASLFSLSATIMAAALSYEVLEKRFLLLKSRFEQIQTRPI
jgi:peptidoglycan/LPS O-acetylase OafA/YrhL